VILTGDYHTHTPYSHGKNTVDENVAKAVAMGLKQVAITDHGFSHVVYGLRRREVSAYIAECKAAEKKYGIDVLVGIESNIRGESGLADLKESDYENFDVFLCGNHVFIFYENAKQRWKYGWGNFLSANVMDREPEKLVQRNTRAYINAIKRNPVDVITHLNFRCPSNVLEVAKCAADYGTYIELNSKKRHLTDEELSDIVAKTEARFIIDSDAHSASRVGDTKLVEEQLSALHFPMDRIDNIEGRYPRFRFAEYKKHL